MSIDERGVHYLLVAHRANGNGVTEPAPTYTTEVESKTQAIDETAVGIAAHVTGTRPDTVRRWVETAVGGAIPLRGTFAWDAWVAYRAAVVSRRPQEPGHDRRHKD